MLKYNLLQICIQCPGDENLFERIQTQWTVLSKSLSTSGVPAATKHHQFAINFENRNRFKEALEHAEEAESIVKNVLPYDHPIINQYKQHIDAIRGKLITNKR